jgi:hypothetical protein
VQESTGRSTLCALNPSATAFAAARNSLFYNLATQSLNGTARPRHSVSVHSTASLPQCMERLADIFLCRGADVRESQAPKLHNSQTAELSKKRFCEQALLCEP